VSKLHITAYCWQQEKRVDLNFNSIREAKKANPSLTDFEIRE